MEIRLPTHVRAPKVQPKTPAPCQVQRELRRVGCPGGNATCRHSRVGGAGTGGIGCAPMGRPQIPVTITSDFPDLPQGPTPAKQLFKQYVPDENERIFGLVGGTLQKVGQSWWNGAGLCGKQCWVSE